MGYHPASTEAHSPKGTDLMLNSALVAAHVLAAIVWVGGMFFAYMALRPAAVATLEPPARLSLWAATFGRFFPWVWLSVVLLPATGYGMIFGWFGGFAGAPLYVHLMNGLGIVMILIYLHVYFAPYRRLRRAVAETDWATGGRALSQIRMLVGINLLIGLTVAAIATGGRMLG